MKVKYSDRYLRPVIFENCNKKELERTRKAIAFHYRSTCRIGFSPGIDCGSVSFSGFR